MMLRRVNTSVLSTSSSPCCVVLGGRTTHPTQQQQQQQRRLLMVQSSCCMLACPCPSHMPRCSHLVRVGGAVKPLPSTTLSPAINSTRLLNYAKLSLMQSSASLYSSSTATNATNATATATASTEEQAQSFSSLQLSEPIQRALQVVFKYSTMSDVQAAVLDPQLQQTDLLVKAKTGTGKTLAFLISAIERLANGDPDEWQAILDGKRGTSILIISPTRELAMQIRDEARKLLKYLPLNTQLFCGGEKRDKQLNAFHRMRADVLVATPGRLIDFLGSEMAVKSKLKSNRVLILDEADRLLELGFREAIDEIGSHLPTAPKRQTLLFSATVSQETRQVASHLLADDYQIVDCVPPNEANTHLKTRQTYVSATFSEFMPTLHHILAAHRTSSPTSVDEATGIDSSSSPSSSPSSSATGAKMVVFFPTAAMVVYFAEIFQRMSGAQDQVLGGEIMQIHSRLSQDQRTRVSARFRGARNAILFTTDVSARGVDYPGVSLVVQVGAPKCREDYIHRIGRTGRAGKTGESIIMLSPYESAFLKEISDLPIRKDVRYNAQVAMAETAIVDRLKNIARKAPTGAAIDVFKTYEGSNMSNMKRFRLSGSTLQKMMDEFGENLLYLDEIPQSRRSSQSGHSRRNGGGDGSGGFGGRNGGGGGGGGGGFRRGGDNNAGGRSDWNTSSPSSFGTPRRSSAFDILSVGSRGGGRSGDGGRSQSGFGGGGGGGGRSGFGREGKEGNYNSSPRQRNRF